MPATWEERAFEEYDTKFGLETEGVFTVHYYGARRPPRVYCGRLRNILRHAIDNGPFFATKESILYGYIVKTEITYVEPYAYMNEVVSASGT